MNNLFDSTNYPDTEPRELVIGSRWAWKRPDITSVYATSAYTLKYVFADQDGSQDITITASKVDSAHVVELASTVTATYKPSDFKWKAIIVRDSDSEEIVLDEGFATVVKQKGNVSSHVYKVLMAIRAMLEEKATKDQMSYTINGRTLQRYTFDQLMKLEAQYARRYKKEQDAINLKNGRSTKSRVLTKLGA